MDDNGNLIKAFSAPASENENEIYFCKYKIKVMPLLRHDVSFSPYCYGKYNSLPTQSWGLYKSPSQVKLSPGDNLFMYSDALSSGKPFKSSKSNKRSPKSVKISVLNRSLSRKHILPVSSNSSIREIKQILENLSNIPVAYQSLLFNGKYVADDKVLSELDIIDNSLSFLWDIDYKNGNVQDNFEFHAETKETGVVHIYPDERSIFAWDNQKFCEINLFIGKP